MLNLGGWLNEKSEDLEYNAERDMENGHVIKGVGKAFLSGAVDGITNGLIVNGLLLTTVMIVGLIENSKTDNEE